MIRLQQLQQQSLNQGSSGSVIDDNCSTAATIDSNSTLGAAVGGGRALSPVSAYSRSGRLSRENSTTSASRGRRRRSGSRASTTTSTSSPSFPTGNFIPDNASDTSASVPWLGSSHSDMAFYIAEAQMLTRENEMLKRRIRELERQVSELSSKSSAAGSDVASPGGTTS